jgi:trimeric autotransporter adhesin
MNFLARPFQLFIFLFAITNFSLAQSNNLASATSINPVTSCGATTGQTLYNANSDGPTNTCAGTANDVWYTFTTPSGVTSVQIDVTVGGGSNLDNTNAFIEAFNANSTAGVIAANTLGCNNIGSGLTLTGLVPSTLYYFRVFTSATPTTTPSNKWAFSICVSYVTPILPPSNDECSGATTLTIGSATAGTVWGATESSSIPAGCASGTPDDDVWYKFIATSSNVNVALSSIASDLNSAGAMLQLSSGACGSLNSVVCGYNSLSTTSLTSGNTYYIRVYSSSSGSIGGTSTGSTFSITVSNASTPSSTTLTSSRMNEVFKLTTISSAGNLNYPWEVTYGPDGYLWITEARGYKVVRMDPNTGQKNTVLDISQGSPFLPSIDQGFNLQFDFGGKGNPQGGLAGLALHPLFLDAVTPKNFVYVSYIHTWVSGSSSGSTEVIYVNRLVRFEYNTATGFLQNPVSLCDTLPGSSDHNSQRMIIAPVSGTYYLFYASGDMGAGQYSNLTRTIKSQDQNSYEGKILRFNLEPVSGSWIPTDNPFGSNSAVWSTGIRNNQGFAYTNINGTGYLYGSSHGPYSDDEINIIEKGKNYGHPLVIGYSGDGNYDGAAAGPSNGSAPPITSESTNASAIGSSYQDPIFTFYPAPKGNTTTANTIQYMWSTNPPNSGWPSEAPSGLDVYANTLIPGWKNSLVSSALKWGRLVRLKLNSTGTGVQSISGQDTATYFDNPNRYRDLAFSPDGKDIYIVMDNNSATSGPGTNNPSIVNCAGCVHKYTFLGYNHNSSTNRSTIPSAIDITSGTSNTLSNGTTITIDATNSNLWVPITGPDGNIMAEIKANGNILGTVTSTFYTSGTVREDANKRLYLNRSITITPQNQPTSTVNVRLYITSAELTALIGATNSQGAGSGVSGIGDLKILKNADANSTALTASALTITPTYAEAFAGTSNGGYVLQADITSFSSFYFENPSNIVLPLELVSFKGILKNNDAHLNWESANENNTSHFIVERSIAGQNFEAIGKVNATGNATGSKYGYIDYDAEKQSSSTVYYRLKMVDKDKAFTYSQIISLNIVQSNMPITAYPNPVNDVLNLKLSVASSERIHIQVTDMQGRTIYSKIKIIRAGADEIKINTKPWAAQSYYINVYDSKNKILFSQKLVKM